MINNGVTVSVSIEDLSREMPHLEPILTLFNNDLGLYRINAFSNVSTFVLSKTKQRIFIYTSVCVLLFLRFHTF